MPLQFPITVTNIALKGEMGFTKPLFRSCEPGAWVSIRPCDPALGDKTYLGIYLGEMKTGFSASFNRENGELVVEPSPLGNPAIFVPDLKRVVMGYESWWGEINSPDELRKITDLDINSVWYVQALKHLSEPKKEDAPDAGT